MRKIPIYQAEIDAGLEQDIVAKSSISFASEIIAVNKFEIPNKIKSIKGFAKADNPNQEDLFYLSSVLASVGWNKNTDVFDPTELWMARATPEDKPFNYQHQRGNVIGHITGSYAVDEQGSVIDENTAVDDLPAKFHLMTKAVLYRFTGDKELEPEMDEIISEIAEGKWFVSMECLFHQFDYALASEDGEQKIVQRNKDTAFLTKHLKIHGGKGEYELDGINYSVGRVLRNFNFCGKALVKKPANPESVIFASIKDFNLDVPNLGYSESKDNSFNESDKEMSKEVDNKDDVALATATQKIAELEKQLRESDVAKANEEKSKVEASLAVANTQIEELNKSLQEKTVELTKAQEEFTKTSDSLKSQTDLLAEAQKELDAIKLERTTAERINYTVETLSVDKAEAAEIVDGFESLSKEVFEKKVAAIAKAMKIKADASQSDDKGTVDEVLDTATAEVADAPLNTETPADKNVEELAVSIANYFCDEDETETN